MFDEVSRRVRIAHRCTCPEKNVASHEGKVMRAPICRGIGIGLVTLVIGLCWLPLAWAQTGAAANPEVVKWAYMSAALVAGLGVLGGAIAVAVVGAAAMGAISEKPELFAQALIFVGLAEGLAIYGLIVAIMILGRV
jgi:V/A-type H+-transporting ATPase subunit K